MNPEPDDIWTPIHALRHQYEVGYQRYCDLLISLDGTTNGSVALIEEEIYWQQCQNQKTERKIVQEEKKLILFALKQL